MRDTGERGLPILSHWSLDPLRRLYQVPKTNPNETEFRVSPWRLSGVYVSEAATLGRVGKRPSDAILEIDVAHSGVFRSRRSICPSLRHLPVRQLICASVAPAPIQGLSNATHSTAGTPPMRPGVGLYRR
jgi:hypothetical protein